jgi:hypothetical protein
MKKFIQILWLIGFIFIINSCVLFRGGAVLQAINEINASALSAENENFQQKAGIELIVVKRGLWSAQSTHKNNMIKLYYKNLLDNQLVFLVNDTQKEFAQQKTIDNIINITINNQYQNYTKFEKEILLIASTSALALLNDSNFNKNEVPNMFFKIIGDYDPKEILGIINAQWFKNKKLLITDDYGIIIE